MVPFILVKKNDGYYVVDSTKEVPTRGPYCNKKIAQERQKRANSRYMNMYYPGGITVHDRYIEYNGTMYPKYTCTERSGVGRYYYFEQMSWGWVEGFIWRYESKTYRDGELYKHCSQIVSGSDLSDHGLIVEAKS